MLYFILSVALNAAPEPTCEQVKLLNGNTVTVCDGRVASVRDNRGNVREYMLDGTIIVRGEGTVPMVLGR